jgi:hypothetical protein
MLFDDAGTGPFWRCDPEMDGDRVSTESSRREAGMDDTEPQTAADDRTIRLHRVGDGDPALAVNVR